VALDVRAVTDEAGFDALGPAWERLSGEGAGDALFGSFVWNRLWWKHYRHLGEPRLIVARNGEEVVGIWPLFLARRNFQEVEIDMIGPRRMVLPGRPFKLGVLAYLGGGEICSDFLAPLVRPGEEEAVIDALVEHLASRKDWHLLDLADMDAASPTLPALRRALTRFGKLRERFRYRAPYAPLAATYDDYLDSLSKKSRYNARKKQRQIELNHRVEHFFQDDPATLDAAMSEFIEQHRQRWNEEGLPGVFVNEHFVGFHREFAAAALARGWLRLGFLRIDGETRFVTYAFQLGDKTYLYQQGGHANWHHYNLGYAALGFSVADACERGSRVYDFLRGDAEYKLHWAKQSRELVQLQAARGLRGRAFVLHSVINTDDAVRRRLKRLVGRKS